MARPGLYAPFPLFSTPARLALFAGSALTPSLTFATAITIARFLLGCCARMTRTGRPDRKRRKDQR